jgi:hypothetical protein
VVGLQGGRNSGQSNAKKSGGYSAGPGGKVGNVQRTVSAISPMAWLRDLDSNLKKLSVELERTTCGNQCDMYQKDVGIVTRKVLIPGT